MGRFYILGVTIVGLLVPSNSEGLNLTERNAAASPFVIAIKKAGIKGLPSLINACLLTSGAHMPRLSCNRKCLAHGSRSHSLVRRFE